MLRVGACMHVACEYHTHTPDSYSCNPYLRTQSCSANCLRKYVWLQPIHSAELTIRQETQQQQMREVGSYPNYYILAAAHETAS